MEKKESAKDRILHVASELFYHEGIRAVGIDRIIAESEVAKASFYRNFATKDDLVVAFLEHRHGRSLSRVTDAKASNPDEPIKQLLYLFFQMAERMKQPDFRGCPFLNTVVEFPNPEHPGHQKAISCRQVLWTDIIQMVRAAGAADPEELAAQLEVLYNGAVMMAYVHKNIYNPDHFYKAAVLLMKDQIPLINNEISLSTV